MSNTLPQDRPPLQLGLVTEPLLKWPLTEVMDWLVRTVPEIKALEIGAGAYATTKHCDTPLFLADRQARDRWMAEITARGLHIGALNVWGNPLHPDTEVRAAHDLALRDAIRLAAELGIERIVAMAGCCAGAPGDATPFFGGGGWLPYLETIPARQWKDWVLPYWVEMDAFVRQYHPRLMICLELHPGTAVYNVESFEALAGATTNIGANIDPSHFFWMHMETRAVVARLAGRVGHAHAKDVIFDQERLALNGLLDRRWPNPPEEMPWNFATVGRGHDADWWRAFVGQLCVETEARTIAIEHEDPFVPPEVGIREAAQLLSGAIAP